MNFPNGIGLFIYSLDISVIAWTEVEREVDT